MVVAIPFLLVSALAAGAGIGFAAGLRRGRRNQDREARHRAQDLRLLEGVLCARVGLTGRWMEAPLGVAELWGRPWEELPGELVETGLSPLERGVWRDHFHEVLRAGPGADIAFEVTLASQGRRGIRRVHLILCHVGPEGDCLPHVRVLVRETLDSQAFGPVGGTFTPVEDRGRDAFRTTLPGQGQAASSFWVLPRA